VENYNTADIEMVAEHERRQMSACKKVKQYYIQPIDLHDFQALNTVSVLITDLLGAMNKADASDYTPLSSVLPLSLKMLSLRYSNFFSDWDPQLEFIYSSDLQKSGNFAGAPWNVDKWVTEEHGAWYEKYYGRLMDFLLLKTEKFPELKDALP
jgi:hypothetical protein